MDKCRINNKIIYIFDFYDKDKKINKENAQLLKKASKEGQLICDYCGEKLRFNYGKINQPYFSHVHDEGKGPCRIFKETNEQKKVKRIFYKKVIEDNFNIYGEINYRFDNGLLADLFFQFEKGEKLVIDYIDDIKKLKRSEKDIYFKENNIKYIKLIDINLNIFNEVQGDSKFGFLYSFVEYDYNNMAILDIDKEIIVLFHKVSFSKEMNLYNEILFKKFPLEKVEINKNGISKSDLRFIDKYKLSDDNIKNIKLSEKAIVKSDIGQMTKNNNQHQISIFDF